MPTFMHSRGAWWKGVTDEKQEVTVSTGFFLHILERQLLANQERPWTIDRAEATYHVAPACFSPQWWVEVFFNHDYAIGMQEHTWTRRRHYAKLVLQPADDRYALIPVPSPGGTIIFRVLAPAEKSSGAP